MKYPTLSFHAAVGSVQRKRWRRFGHPGCFPMANLRIHKKLLRDQCPGPEMNPSLPKCWGPAPFHPVKRWISTCTEGHTSDCTTCPTEIGGFPSFPNTAGISIPRHVWSSEEESLGRQLGWCCSILPVLVNCQLWFVRFVLIHHPQKKHLIHLKSFWTPPKPISSYLKSNFFSIFNPLELHINPWFLQPQIQLDQSFFDVSIYIWGVLKNLKIAGAPPFLQGGAPQLQVVPPQWCSLV